MIRITRNRPELGTDPCLILTVYRTLWDTGTVGGYYDASTVTGRQPWETVSSSEASVMHAFEEAFHHAETNALPAIWINDPDRLFQPEHSC